MLISLLVLGESQESFDERNEMAAQTLAALSTHVPSFLNINQNILNNNNNSILEAKAQPVLKVAAKKTGRQTEKSYTSEDLERGITEVINGSSTPCVAIGKYNIFPSLS